MSIFTKTLTATAVAVVMSSPAAADINGKGDVDGAFVGSKTTVKIKPAGCPNATVKDIDTVIGFGDLSQFLEFDYMPHAGCWGMAGFSFDEFGFVGGAFIERKIGKDLTMSLTAESLFDGIVDEVYYYLDSESKCDLDDMDWDDFVVKKGNGKLSKNGDRIKVDIQVDGKYMTTDDKEKNVKATIKGKMDFDSTRENPAWDCGLVVID